MKKSGRLKSITTGLCIVCAAALLALLSAGVLFRDRIIVSSGYGVVYVRNIVILCAVCFVASLAAALVTGVKCIRERRREAGDAAFGGAPDGMEDAREITCESVIAALSSYKNSGDELSAYIDTLVRSAKDVEMFKEQLHTLRNMARARNIKSGVGFILSELDDVDATVYEMIMKVQPALNYYIQFKNESGSHARQYVDTALLSVEKRVENVSKLLAYYRNVVNVLDRAVREEQMDDETIDVMEAEAILNTIKSFTREGKYDESN